MGFDVLVPLAYRQDHRAGSVVAADQGSQRRDGVPSLYPVRVLTRTAPDIDAGRLACGDFVHQTLDLAAGTVVISAAHSGVLSWT
jgi:hypothetical protein